MSILGDRLRQYSVYTDAPPPSLKKQKPERVIVERVIEHEPIERVVERIIEKPVERIIEKPIKIVPPEPKELKPKLEEIKGLQLEERVVEKSYKIFPINSIKEKKTKNVEYRASGKDIIEMSDNLRKLSTWEDFSSFLVILKSKNLVLRAKGSPIPLDNFNYDGKWLRFDSDGINSKQVIPGLWKMAQVGRI